MDIHYAEAAATKNFLETWPNGEEVVRRMLLQRLGTEPGPILCWIDGEDLAGELPFVEVAVITE